MLKSLFDKACPDSRGKDDEISTLNKSHSSLATRDPLPPTPSDQLAPNTVHGDRVVSTDTANTTHRSAVSAPTVLRDTTVDELRFYQGGVRQKYKSFVKWVGRIGFIAKGIVYGCIGVLTITNVTGAWTPNGSEENESPQGAFLLLGGIPSIGRTILIIMAVGLVLYIIWRMWEAITGQGSDASFSKKKNFFRYRLSPFVSGLVYSAYTYYVIRMIFQTEEEQQVSASSNTFPASWTKSQLGKAGIGILAIAFMIAFTTQIINAVTGNFIKDLRTSEPNARKWEAFIVHMFGRVGFGGRAALFGTMAGFFWDSLATANESGDKNMVAAAINKLANSGGGRFFMVVLGVSLVIYAVFAVSNAYYKYFPTPPPTRQEYYTNDLIVPGEPRSSGDSSSAQSEQQDHLQTKVASSTAEQVKENYKKSKSTTSWKAKIPFIRNKLKETDPEK